MLDIETAIEVPELPRRREVRQGVVEPAGPGAGGARELNVVLEDHRRGQLFLHDVREHAGMAQRTPDLARQAPGIKGAEIGRQAAGGLHRGNALRAQRRAVDGIETDRTGRPHGGQQRLHVAPTRRAVGEIDDVGRGDHSIMRRGATRAVHPKIPVPA